MFAREHKQEYDPTSSPMIERPLATGRPLSVQQGNVHGGSGLGNFRQGETKRIPINGALGSPVKMNGIPKESPSPNKAQSSPTKSSMSAQSRYAQVHQPFDPESSIWSEEEDEDSAKRELPPGKSLRRHAKSVTFDAAPPQVNEYEMTTPDPSSVASGSREGSYESVNEEEDESFDRGSSIERDDSFDASLEDTEKTPVVLPEDWRFMSPAIANEDLAAHVDNPFDGERSSPAPTTQPSAKTDARLSPTRTDSVNSNGERRPLPPLPAIGMPAFSHTQSDLNGSLSATAERASSFQRASPSPPRPASISKAEIQGMGGCSMSIEDRLRLMMIDDPDKRSAPIEGQQEQQEMRLQRESLLRGSDLEEGDREVRINEQEIENDDVAELGEYKLPPRISRESILRKVKSRTFNEPEDDNSYLGLSPTSDTGAYDNLDPDIPIPSLETEAVEKEVIIKQEPDVEDSDVDVYSIPDLYSQQLQAESYMNAIEKLEAFKASSAAQTDDDDESHYSVDSKESGHQERKSDSATDEGPPTPRALTSNGVGPDLKRKNSHRMSLPQFAALLGESEFGFDMEPFMVPSINTSQEPVKPVLSSQPSWTSEVPSEKSFLEQSMNRPTTPEEQLLPPRFPGQWSDLGDEPKTPDSVIRHTIPDSPTPDSPSVPEPVATIKAPGGKLKTRPSVTPADVEAMAEIRRQVSNGSQVPAVPKIPERHLSRPSIVAESDEPLVGSASEAATATGSEERDASKLSKRKSSLLPLEVSMQAIDGLGIGIESEFDRVMEAQKVAFNFLTPDMASRPWSPSHAENMTQQGFRSFREGCTDEAIRSQKGYLMRQNTKVIIASSASHESAEPVMESKDTQDPAVRGTRSAGNSPRKPSHTQTWTAEPWNGKIRRKSIRKSGGVPSKATGNGPAPPLPGQQSNVASGLGSVTEDDSLQNTEEIGEDGERGRLFVKVVRVKDLDLPLPKGLNISKTLSCFHI